MWKQITEDEAVEILVMGGKVDNGFDLWGGTLQLMHPAHYRKARKRKELKRDMKRYNTGRDGWWVYIH